MMLLKIALRNVLRNPRRTAVNLLMGVGGFCAIVLFKGFSANIIHVLERTAIEGQHGHIQVATTLTWDQKPVETAIERMITNPEEIEKKISSAIQTKYVSGRLPFYGLISSPDRSISARAEAYDPSKEVMLRDYLWLVEGRIITDPNAFEINMGEGLMKQMQAKVGDRVTILAQTLAGAINAVDVEIVGIVKTTVAEVDNITFYLPVKVAQKVLDTDAVERLVVFLPQTEGYEAARDQLAPALPETLRAQTWFELATLFRQTKDYFGVQNRIIEGIILVLVLLSISNIVGNSVVERTGEIGTVRAMGETRRGVVFQFFLEGLILAILTFALGAIFGVLLTKILNNAGILLPIPGATQPIPLTIDILPGAFLQAGLLTSFTAIIATIVPATRATRISVVEALKRNI